MKSRLGILIDINTATLLLLRYSLKAPEGVSIRGEGDNSLVLKKTPILLEMKSGDEDHGLELRGFLILSNYHNK